MCNGCPGGVGRGGEAAGGLHGRETAKKTLQKDEQKKANPNEDSVSRTAWVSAPSPRRCRARQSEVRTVGEGACAGEGARQRRRRGRET